MSNPYGFLHRILTKDLVFLDSVTGSAASGWKNVNTLLQKTFLFYNGTDKSGSFQLSGSRTDNGSIAWEIGSLITLNASGSTYYSSLSDIFPFINIYINFTSEPTSGSASCWCFGRED